MDMIFWICVKIMQVMSDVLGITYQELNVLLFVIIHPILTLSFIFLYKKYKRLYIKQCNKIKLNNNELQINI